MLSSAISVMLFASVIHSQSAVLAGELSRRGDGNRATIGTAARTVLVGVQSNVALVRML